MSVDLPNRHGPRIYSYVVARDYGFAPNPFFGFCTLATCKPLIRRNAEAGDCVVGTGSTRFGLEGHLVFVMWVAEAMSFDAYWKDRRFRQKRPNLRGSLKQSFGDNIYHRDPSSGRWRQEDSHHSRPNGGANAANVRHDTRTDRVLVATDFSYWGGQGPRIPSRFRRGPNLCAGRGHKCVFPEHFRRAALAWLQKVGNCGYVGEPREFGRQLLVRRR